MFGSLIKILETRVFFSTDERKPKAQVFRVKSVKSLSSHKAHGDADLYFFS